MSANKRLQELAIVFIWNYNNKAANDFVKYAEGMLSRDIERPFSREIDLPLFFYPGKGKNVPVDISVNAERVIVYPILDCETVTEDCWQEYFNNVLDMENGIIVPVAFEENCFISGSRDKAIHHIRAYEFKEFLGKGGFGQVWKVTRKGKLYAIKVPKDIPIKPYEVSPQSNLNVFFGKGREAKNGLVKPRHWYDNSLTKNK